MFVSISSGLEGPLLVQYLAVDAVHNMVTLSSTTLDDVEMQTCGALM